MIALLAALLAIVPVTNNSVSYSCDGSTSAFSINFPYIVNTDLVVTSTTSGGAVTTLTPTTDWTVTLTTLQSGTATLTVNVPATKCPSGSTLKIVNNPSATQPYGFRAQTQYNTALHEQAYDREMMVIQNALNFAKTCPAHNWVSGWSGLLSPTCTQPTFSDMSGTLPVTSLAGILAQAQGGTGSSALTCTNQFLSSNGTAYACALDTLASAQHANQGTASTVLHGNAAGNPAWGSVSLTTDVTSPSCGGKPLTSAGGGLTCATSLSGLTVLTTSGMQWTDVLGVQIITGGGLRVTGSDSIVQADSFFDTTGSWGLFLQDGGSHSFTTNNLMWEDLGTGISVVTGNFSVGSATLTAGTANVAALNSTAAVSAGTSVTATTFVRGATVLSTGGTNGHYGRTALASAVLTDGADFYGTDNEWHFRANGALYVIAPLKAGSVALVAGTKSVTLPVSGMVCTCHDNTTAANNANLTCPVSATTLTLTGTGTDTIAYTCMVAQ